MVSGFCVNWSTYTIELFGGKLSLKVSSTPYNSVNMGIKYNTEQE